MRPHIPSSCASYALVGCEGDLTTGAGVLAVTGELEQQVGLGGDDEHLAVDYGAMVWASTQGKVCTLYTPTGIGPR